MTKVYTDVVYQVGNEGEPHLTIRPHPDDPTGAIELVTLGISVEHWGPLSLWLSKPLAAELGRALIKAAEQEKKQ